MSKFINNVTMRVYCQGFCSVALPRKEDDQPQTLALGRII